MSRKRKINVILNVIIVVLSLILVYCLYRIGSIMYEKKQSNKVREEKVETFKQDIIQEDPEIVNNPEYDPFEKIEGQTVGLIFTNNPQYEEATLVYIDIFDEAGVVEALMSNVVMYTNYGGIGIPGSNTVMSSHSSVYECNYCYFNELEEYKEGDIIDILWHNKKIYRYKVESVFTHQDPEAAWYYSQPDDNSQLITLMTCTDGLVGYRTAVVAKLYEIADWRGER